MKVRPGKRCLGFIIIKITAVLDTGHVAQLKRRPSSWLGNRFDESFGQFHRCRLERSGTSSHSTWGKRHYRLETYEKSEKAVWQRHRSRLDERPQLLGCCWMQLVGWANDLNPFHRVDSNPEVEVFSGRRTDVLLHRAISPCLLLTSTAVCFVSSISSSVSTLHLRR